MPDPKTAEDTCKHGAMVCEPCAFERGLSQGRLEGAEAMKDGAAKLCRDLRTYENNHAMARGMLECVKAIEGRLDHAAVVAALEEK